MIRDFKHTEVIPVKTSNDKGAMPWKILFPTQAKATVPRESRQQPRSCASRVWVSDCRPNRHPLVRSAPLKVSTAIYNRPPIEPVPPHLFRTRRYPFRVYSTRSGGCARVVLHQPRGLCFRLPPPWTMVQRRLVVVDAD